MPIQDDIQDLVASFVVADRRLQDHPKLAANVRWRDGNVLILLAGTGPYLSSARTGLPIADNSVTSYCFRSQKPCILEDIVGVTRLTRSFADSKLVEAMTLKACAVLPLMQGETVVGTISVVSTEAGEFIQKHLGRIQMLGALVAYAMVDLRDGQRMITSSSIALGKALTSARHEMGLNQTQLAERIGCSRIALSRWERGSQAPSRGPLAAWCEALGLLSRRGPGLVTVVDVTPELLRLLRQDPSRLHGLSPERFEHFVAERLDRMGYAVTLTSPTNRKDGGIDLVAVPKSTGVGRFLIAGQVKHHSQGARTGREAVDRLLSWKDSPFRLGLLVTNTGFTKDAFWVASQPSNRAFLRLRDFQDLARWLEDNFWSAEEWREIPDMVEVAPGISVRIPKASLSAASTIWPIGKLEEATGQIE